MAASENFCTVNFSRDCGSFVTIKAERALDVVRPSRRRELASFAGSTSTAGIVSG